jgi:4-azaleucine resistance transporter AzlC
LHYDNYYYSYIAYIYRQENIPMKKDIIKGLKTASPIALGYLPLGMAFGILAAQQGLTALDVFFLSLLVYAGSAQFIASAMLASGAAAAAIILTTFLVNLRHLLMSASLAPFLKHISSPVLTWISMGITDETYAAGYPEASSGKATPAFYIGLNGLSHFCWIFSTVSGCLLGSRIPNPEKWGLDLCPACHVYRPAFHAIEKQKGYTDRSGFRYFICSLAFVIKDNFNIIAATVAAAFIGVCIEK